MHFTVRVTIDKPDHAEPGIYYLKKTQNSISISQPPATVLCVTASYWWLQLSKTAISR